MFCPQCSQQQPAEATRFCSRCGFTLSGIAMIVENNGMIPQVAEQSTGLSRNRIMLEGGAMAIFPWAIAFASTFWFNASGIGEGIAKFAALLFFVLGLIGLFRFMYAFLFVKEKGSTASSLSANTSAAKSFLGEAKRSALHPQTEAAISDYPLRPNTREIVPRASVTENTTRLLDEK